MEFTLTALSAAIRSGTLSAEALVATCLQRIEALNPAVNAFSQVFADDALREARACDRERAEGRLRGPLHGIPMGVKDLFMVKGQNCQRGSAVYRDHVATDTAPIVARMQAAGAIIIGRTTTTELGWSGSGFSEFYGPTRNPWNPALTSGGSSSGSGAALAARMVPLALGSDGGGSVRIPAAFCGVFAMKGSLGRVPAWPWSATEMLSHAAPMTLTAEDSALAFNLAKGPDPRDHQALPDDGLDYLRSPLPEGLRVGFAPTLFGARVTPGVAEVVASAVATLGQRMGVQIAGVAPDWQDPIGIFETLWIAGRGVAYGEGAALEQFGSGFRGLIAASRSYGLADYIHAQRDRAGFCGQVHGFFERFDLLLTPTLPLTAFDAELEAPPGWPRPSEALAWTGWTPFTYPFNISGNPAASLPCGLAADGMPVGLQVIGRRHQDAQVMAFCREAERHLRIEALPPTVAEAGVPG